MIVLFFFFLFGWNALWSDQEPEPSKLLQIGNLAFPVSQQPTPLLSFGQNLIAKGDSEIQLQGGEFKGKGEYFIDTQLSFIYAFEDNFSIFVNIPRAIRFKRDHETSSGMEDLYIQLEYAPYTKEYRTFYDQFSIVGNVILPTGSSKKTPSTGFGSPSFFIGGLYSRMGINWFSFTSYGVILTTMNFYDKAGNQFLYQYGFGRRIFNTKDWLFAWMIECNGFYSEKDKMSGETIPNSGGNLIYVTPSLFIAAKKHFTWQTGVGFPIVQQLFGKQNRKEFLVQSRATWNF